jgi:hypothetical protein
MGLMPIESAYPGQIPHVNEGIGDGLLCFALTQSSALAFTGGSA